MFLGAYFTTGRIIFMIFFIISFIALMIYSYRKDLKNHQRYYKGAVKKVVIYGGTHYCGVRCNSFYMGSIIFLKDLKQSLVWSFTIPTACIYA